MLIQWAEEVYPSEKDLLITRSVLMHLCLQNLKDANIVYSLFKSRYPALDTPLFNYTRFLLLTLERDALPLFDLLRTTYQKSLQRDPTFLQVLSLTDNQLSSTVLTFALVLRPNCQRVLWCTAAE